MKKTILIVILFTTTFLTSFSQFKGNTLISVTGGAAFPLGKYASDNVNDHEAGTAKTGGSVSISAARFLSKNFGVALDLHGQRNPINTTTFEEEFNKEYTNFPGWKFKKTKWSFGAIMVGAVGQFYVDHSKKLSFVAKATAGVMFAKLPGLEGTSNSFERYGHADQTRERGNGFVFSYSAGLTYPIFKKIFIVADARFLASGPISFNNVVTKINTIHGAPGSPYSVYQNITNTVSGTQKISSVNISLGLAFQF